MGKASRGGLQRFCFSWLRSSMCRGTATQFLLTAASLLTAAASAEEILTIDDFAASITVFTNAGCFESVTAVDFPDGSFNGSRQCNSADDLRSQVVSSNGSVSLSASGINIDAQSTLNLSATSLRADSNALFRVSTKFTAHQPLRFTATGFTRATANQSGLPPTTQRTQAEADIFFAFDDLSAPRILGPRLNLVLGSNPNAPPQLENIIDRDGVVGPGTYIMIVTANLQATTPNTDGIGFNASAEARAFLNMQFTPLIACCDPNGFCQEVTAAECASIGGQPSGQPTCEAADCFVPTGACCTGSNCLVRTEDACLAAGGLYFGDDTSCGGITCDLLQWSNASGGEFNTAANWTPPRRPEHGPERSDTVVFALGGQYPVNATGAQAGRMIVRNGIVDILGNAQFFSSSLEEPSLLVGDNGILNVIGGTFRTVHSALGESSVAQGEVAVLNSGTRWESNGRLLVGDAGPGKLSVVNGFASALETRIGGGAHAGGDVIVGGASGRFESGSLAVGFGGPGQLEIRDGGTVVSTDASIGRVLAGPHTVEVYSHAKSGVPSRWSVPGILAVASGGPGLLTIREGGEVVADAVLIGNVGEGAGLGAGEIIVEGASVGGHRALLEALGGGPLLIGNGSPADLAVRAGGLVRSVGDIAIGNTTVGRAVVEGSVGAGEDSVRSSIELEGELSVGLNAEGSLRIADGGRVTASEFLAGDAPGSSANIVVDGAFLAIDGSGRMGGGNSEIVLKNGSVAAFEEKLDLGVTAGGKAVVRLFGDASILVKSDLALGKSGESIVEAVDGALVTARDFSSVKESGEYPVRATFRGRSPGGTPSSLDADNLTWFAGELEFLDGALGGVEGVGMDFGHSGVSALLISGSGGGEPSRLRVKGDALFGVGQNASTVIEIVEGGVLDVGGRLSMGLFSGGLVVLQDEGSLIQSGGDFETGGPGYHLLVDKGGKLETGAVSLEGDSSLVQLKHPTAGLAWFVDGGMRVGTSAGAGSVDLVLCGASIVAFDTVLIGPRGTLNTFFGIVDAPVVSVQGVMTYKCDPPSAPPGPPVSKSDGPGALTITGDLILEPGARMEMRVFGPGESDALDVQGNFTAGGTLDILFEGGYSPAAGDQFALLNIGGNALGAFENIRFPNLQPGFQFDAELTSGGFVLTALSDGALETPVSVGISGFVSSTADNEPLSCAVVELTNADASFRITAVTDLNGRYFFEPQEEGEYQVRVMAPGFTTITPEAITLEEDQEPIERDFALTPANLAGSVTGRVADSVIGEPLVGVLVEMRVNGESVADTFTCADGRYALTVPGGAASLRFSLENFADDIAATGVVAGADIDASLEPLEDGSGVVAGIVEGDTGDGIVPLDDARITLRGPINVSTESDVDGSYLLDNLLAGSYSVTASAPGYQGQSVQRILEGGLTTADFLLLPLEGDAGVFGDINGDGWVNAVDVQLVINAALGLALPQGFDADVNGDGVVNAIDVQLVINAALGINTSP